MTDPFARLLRTLDTVTKLVFGDRRNIARMRSRLAKRHAPAKLRAMQRRAQQAA